MAAPTATQTTDSLAPNHAKPQTSPKRLSDAVELSNVSSNGKKSAPDGADLMQYARAGNLGSMQELFESARFDATYKDEEGITPLHVSKLLRPFVLDA